MIRVFNRIKQTVTIDNPGMPPYDVVEGAAVTGYSDLASISVAEGDTIPVLLEHSVSGVGYLTYLTSGEFNFTVSAAIPEGEHDYTLSVVPLAELAWVNQPSPTTCHFRKTTVDDAVLAMSVWKQITVEFYDDYMPIPTDHAASFHGTFVAANASGSTIAFEVVGACKNVAGTASLVGTPTVTVVGDQTSAAVALTVGTGSGGLKFFVEGPIGTAYKVTGKIEVNQVAFAA